jgi:V/A-type H+-transporting ATPase subunit E
MSDINRLTEKILEESKTKGEKIIAAAEEEGARLLEKKITEAKALEEDIISKAKIEGASTKERIISNAKLKARNEKLEAKQQMLQKVFDSALESLNQLSSEKYLEFIKASILELKLTGEQNLILNEKATAFVTVNYIDELNAKLIKQGSNFTVKLSNKVGSFKGGFILERDGIEINYSFEALIASSRDELEYEITKLLFA